MSTYYNPETGEYPVHIGDLQLMYTEMDLSLGIPSPWVEVLTDNYPELATYEVAEPSSLPVLIDGVWQVNWTIREMTDLEKDKVDNPAKYSFAQKIINQQNSIENTEEI